MFVIGPMSMDLNRAPRFFARNIALLKECLFFFCLSINRTPTECGLRPALNWGVPVGSRTHRVPMFPLKDK